MGKLRPGTQKLLAQVPTTGGSPVWAVMGGRVGRIPGPRVFCWLPPVRFWRAWASVPLSEGARRPREAGPGAGVCGQALPCQAVPGPTPRCPHPGAKELGGGLSLSPPWRSGLDLGGSQLGLAAVPEQPELCPTQPPNAKAPQPNSKLQHLQNPKEFRAPAPGATGSPNPHRRGATPAWVAVSLFLPKVASPTCSTFKGMKCVPRGRKQGYISCSTDLQTQEVRAGVSLPSVLLLGSPSQLFRGPRSGTPKPWAQQRPYVPPLGRDAERLREPDSTETRVDVQPLGVPSWGPAGPAASRR